MNVQIFLLVFGVIFIAELPDKSLFAALILGSKYPRFAVWLGAAAAFLIHVVIAVTAGKLLALLPSGILHLITALLFLGGAILIMFGKHGLEETPQAGKLPPEGGHNFWKIFSIAFGVVFIGELGDITQITTANFAAHYHSPWSVGLGATLGLWSVTAVAIIFGTRAISLVPAKVLQRLTAAILLLFAILSVISAAK